MSALLFARSAWKQQTRKHALSLKSTFATVQVRELLHGAQTVLGDAAATTELFVTDTWLEFPLSQVQGVAAAAHLQQAWDVSLRLKQFQEDEKRREENAARQAAGRFGITLAKYLLQLFSAVCFQLS